MKLRNYAYMVLAVLALTGSDIVFGKNCKKGQPCGNSCISWGKTCHKSRSTYSGGSDASDNGVGDISIHQYNESISKVYVVVDEKINAYMSPNSSKKTGTYKRGDTVLVYQLFGGWARLTNAKPNQWVKLSSLKKK